MTQMTKQQRHFIIKGIVSTGPVASQDDLRRQLRRHGCAVTQATLSRDINDIGIVRQGGRYVLQVEQEVIALKPLVGAEVVSVAANELLIVVHTLPGCANTVGEFVDVQKNPDIIGTVAGDNTLLVIPRSHRKTQNVIEFLKHTLIEGA
jgi:transcriptional regulator of arginine metabolism